MSTFRYFILMLMLGVIYDIFTIYLRYIYDIFTIYIHIHFPPYISLLMKIDNNFILIIIIFFYSKNIIVEATCKLKQNPN